MKTMDYLRKLWAQLGDVPTVEDESGDMILDEPWHCFEKGCPVNDIWHWFEEQNEEFSVAREMGFKP